MGLSRKITDDLTTPFNSVYQINRDVAGWDKMTVQVVAPIYGALYIYGTLDAGEQQQNTQGNATLAINYTPIQATNLATGTAVATITAAGMYAVNASNQQFVRLQGNPAGTPTNVYRILITNSKIG